LRLPEGPEKPSRALSLLVVLKTARPRMRFRGHPATGTFLGRKTPQV